MTYGSRRSRKSRRRWHTKLLGSSGIFVAISAGLIVAGVFLVILSVYIMLN
jgi:hypothetical protein